MKAKRIYGLMASLAAMAVCASAFAQSGPPPDDQNGPPPPMGGQMGGPGMRRMGPPMEPLIMRPDVCKELKLTDDQLSKIKALFPPPMGGPDGGPGGGGQGGPPPRGGVRDQRGGPPQGDSQAGGPPPRDGNGDGPRRGPDMMDDQLAKILNDGQMKRLKELRLQRQGAMALSRPEVASQVGLSDDERQKVRGMIDEAMESMRGNGDDGQRPDRDAMQAMHAKLGDKILASLTPKERGKWDELTGKPFKFDESWHPPRPDMGQRRGGGQDAPPPPQGGAPDDGGNR